MSHNIEHYDYAENVNKKKVQTDLDNYVAHADWQEGCSGLSNPIRWMDSYGICDSREEAEDYIRRHDKGWYDSLAVRYREYGKVESKKYNELKTATNEAYKRYNELSNKVHYADAKSEYIGCKECGSKIARKYLKRNTCPVCGKDLRPQSTIDAIKRAKDKWEKLEKDLKTEEKKLQLKQKASAKVRWLVKIEYHT